MKVATLSVLSILLYSALSHAATYASPKARQVIDQVVAAHGGMERWNRAKTLSFSHILTFGPPLAAQWGISEEVTDIKTLRTYQLWPLDGALLGNDGAKTWTKNWQGFSFPNMNANQFYRTLSMPWSIASMPYLISEPSTGKLVADSIEYITVKMNFEPSTGESPEWYYRLFIHPQTHLIKAVEYTVTYGAFLDLINLPKEKTFFGPMTHIYFEYVKVDGLIFPKKYDTFGEDGARHGSHVAYNYSLAAPFDESKMKMPADAVIDTSSKERKSH
ncbi:MAG: hypothetical protein L0196_10135 [candidate division Zixibacteria bacterium]|nr:hypothetical protein [candidate division Zixibacteria bacterium]